MGWLVLLDGGAGGNGCTVLEPSLKDGQTVFEKRFHGTEDGFVVAKRTSF